MQVTKLKGGAQISMEIRIDSPLDTQNGIETYLASDVQIGHVLVHLIPDGGNQALNQLQKAVDFYSSVLELECRCGRVAEGLFFAEPFPLGEYMFEWLEKRERVSLPEAIKRVITQLKYLQQAAEVGLHHGRLTPKSILLERSFDDFELRMMGLGVAQAMDESQRMDIDWFDYTFDLEGMNPQAVDIYGMAIILMGLVSGESGIDSFEATGLLPPILRGGLLQQAMERALALRVDSYNDILSFSQDLEAALLELDGKQGELFISDLVGFESAVKSIASIAEESGVMLRESSGSWSALVDNMGQDERSSVLRSLTSLTAVKAVEDEDEDITRVSAVPDFVLNTRRIRSAHGRDMDDSLGVPSYPGLKRVTDEEEVVPAPTEDAGKTLDLAAIGSYDEETSKKLADLQNMEAELDYEPEEDDAPTRVMQRPNYMSINLGQEEAESHDKPSEEDKLQTVIQRIQSADVIAATHTVGHDVTYDLNDPVAFPEGPDVPETEEEPVSEYDKYRKETAEIVEKLHTSSKKRLDSKRLSNNIIFLVIGLGMFVIILLFVLIMKVL